ncbi:phosphoribosylglycinamide formyltransferase [Polychytrium aggregatum]|uniref:phosphoribosylglycinamide formyltransferase n=1 Tax=Polychytrium aggregatum TaxID=110093 RepID=UPI0022FF10AE|nr:phosphoribosylglycinamide formyltransferase [Polychytrium aggregatum]KAI9193391.1 phosphoribosylglycinamide formyltransferase [Polychytrium aggregatum]
MSKHSIVVLISGFGSNLQALIDASKLPTANFEISLVVSNKKSAYGLERAAQNGIPTFAQSLKTFKDEGKTRVDFDVALAKEILARSQPKLIVLAGWMHILSPEFLSFFPGKVINLHPALPGQFDGAHAIERAFEAFKKGEIKNTGIMVHRVIPEVDRGEVILKQEIPILDSDTLEALEERIHSHEHQLIVAGTIEALKAL